METYSKTVRHAIILFNQYFCGATPPPLINFPYSSAKGIVKNVPIWHRDVQPGIVQRSNQIISRGRYD